MRCSHSHCDGIAGIPDFVPDDSKEPEIYVGAFVFDPAGRFVKVIAETKDLITVQLAGPYGATMSYPPSCLRAWKKP